ncbi:sulfite oxidase [Paucibacter sp. APW11]|uniref:Sulfite oxidase n=1 Tax=Roseateles aquae TaxID=3077235 RepID=A0ABU3PCC3_9BURK|nr:sulfite oxidase [Paucibacter sp. APW11]MDT9000227.1 sulfite oxidase [Paucibacter sp. APW11]
MSHNDLIARRRMLGGAATALGAIGLSGWAQAQTSTPTAPAAAVPPAAKPLPAYAAWKNPAAMVVHSATTIETRRSAFGTGLITPAQQLYIRNNLPAPNASILEQREAWTISLEGVKQPRSMTLAELKTLGLETVATVLQCSGNGRGFFPSKPSGTPWTVGAAGCVLWTGVPLRNVVAALGGLADDAKFITGTGGEKLPEGIDPLSVVVERSVPIKALDDCLLAWDMNGEPLSLAHGGPLRLIVPGYQGVNNIKYIKRLAFGSSESKAKIMAHGYRITPPGAQSGPEQESVWEMNVKSWINGPLPEAGAVKAGLVQLHGVAFGGSKAIARVEVSTDDGKTWHPARLTGPDLGRFAWRQFAVALKLPAGNYQVASRAVDSAGNVQPAERLENAHGYNNNSWRDHAIQLTVA